MASYLVLRPGDAAALDDTLFVRDGLNWLGLVLPPLYLAIHRLWMPLAFVLAGLLAAGTLADLAGIEFPVVLAWVLTGLYVGLEGPELRVNKLAAEHWELVDVVVASRLSDAEALYFSALAQSEPDSAIRTAPAWELAATPASRLSGPALGLVDPYGGR